MRTLTPTKLAAGLGAVALVAALAACGSSDTGSAGAATPSAGSSSAAGSAGVSDNAAAAVTATEADFSIALSSSDVPAGTYTFTVQNKGKATHSLTIKGPGGVDQTSDTVQGGESTTMTVTLQPGKYEVYCPIGNHRAMGMDTTLTVT